MVKAEYLGMVGKKVLTCGSVAVLQCGILAVWHTRTLHVLYSSRTNKTAAGLQLCSEH